MENQTDSALAELMQLCTMCNNHRFTQDSYSAPGFTNFLNRPLTIDDIPMESYNSEDGAELSRDPKSIPWEDSIKNFILDLTSVSSTEKFSVCMLLTELGYVYSAPTISLLNKKYGNSTTVMVHVVPVDEDMSTYIVTIRREEKVEYCNRIDRNYLVGDLLTWYMPKSTLVFCHNPSTVQYKELLGMMPDITWSVSCTISNFLESSDFIEKCEYICPVYSHSGSMETRAVGSGPISFIGYKLTGKYRGKMNYYFRCIRGSKHSSGRCYDCQILYNLLLSLDPQHKQTSSTVTTKFEPVFLLSISNKQSTTQ